MENSNSLFINSFTYISPEAVSYICSHYLPTCIIFLFRAQKSILSYYIWYISFNVFALNGCLLLSSPEVVALVDPAAKKTDVLVVD